MTLSIHTPILVLAGPTAGGKSSLALSIAQDEGAVIINADSRQLYRELRIITARPTAEEEALAPHKLYGILPAQAGCSAGAWLKLARMEIDWALGQGRRAIVVGGTGLYLKALIEGIAEMPDIDPLVRAQAVSDYEAMGHESFTARLREVDPGFFARLKVADRQRVIRAWEMWLGSGRPLSWWQEQRAGPAYAPEQMTIARLEPPRDALYARCNARFLQMVEQGAVEEVRAFLALGLPGDAPAMKSVGIRELGAYLAGAMTLEEAVAVAQQATRNYAKRQLTWFRHQLKGAMVVP